MTQGVSSESDMASIEVEYRSWASDKQSALTGLSVELQGATETNLQLLMDGGKLEILTPSTYHLGLSTSIHSSEVFLVLPQNMNGKVEASMLALNERLEQVSIQPKALYKVLDLLLVALQKVHEQHGSRKGVCHDELKQEDLSNNRRTRSDWEEEDDQCEDSESCDAEDDDQSDDEAAVNASCYDIASGETWTSWPTEFETRTRGFLHGLVEYARERCKECQIQEPCNIEDPLLWFRVESKPMALTVELQFEVAGLLDDRIAAGLGLSMDEPVALKLEFSKNMWSEPICRSIKALKPDCISAVQLSRGREVPGNEVNKPDDIDVYLEAALGGYGLQSYGLEVLLPELTHKFFHALNHQGSVQASDHLEGLEHNVNNRNPFMGLALFISHQLKLLPGWCLVCWKKLSSSVTRMRTCDQDFCLYRFEELGLGVSVLDEVKSSPELVEVDLSLANTAVESFPSRDVFEPFPAFLLESKEIRGRSGWFSSNHVRETAPELRRHHREEQPKVIVDNFRSNKKVDLLKKVLSSIPPIKELQKCADERSLKKVLTRSWYDYRYNCYSMGAHGGPVKALASHLTPTSSYLVQQSALPTTHALEQVLLRSHVHGKYMAQEEMAKNWLKEAKLAYNVMRFILMTNRLSLCLLKSEDEVLKMEDRPNNLQIEEKLTIHQFVVLHDSPEKEVHFRREREARGSFFAFHGSSTENWYSILRNGLRSMSNTTYMSAGAVRGEGIYLATELATSMRYAKATCASWKNGALKDGFLCVAICEVVNGSPREQCGESSNILVVSRENECDVAIRYLLVFNPQFARTSFFLGRSTRFKIEGHVLSSSNLDLFLHYQLLKQTQEAVLISQQLTRKSARSAVLRAMAAEDPAQTNIIAKNKAPASACEFNQFQQHHLPKRRRVEEEPSLAAITISALNSSAKGSRQVMQELKTLMIAIEKAHPLTSLIQKGDPAGVLSGTTVVIPDEGNLCLWRISLHPYLFKESAALYRDFQTLKERRKSPHEIPMELEVKFPATYPFDPPFVRVLSPKFVTLTGHVTVGGSICMELLTASGWSPACNFESLLVQVVMAVVEGEGRLDTKSVNHKYEETEAREAFLRAARAHGWKTS